MNEIAEINNAGIIQHQVQQHQASDSSAIMRMIEKAMSTPDFDVDKMMKLMDMKERFDAMEAKRAFHEAMANFKLNPPEIFKDKHVKFGQTEYDHATIGNVVGATIAGLAAHGISHRWNPQQIDGKVIVECILTHRLGHSETTRLEASPDASGGKNAIQGIMSAKTYLERHSLLAACGLATKDQVDDDGAGAELPPEPKPIQRMTINGKRFENAILAVKNDGYSPADIRKNFILTTDQETALADAEKEMVAA